MSLVSQAIMYWRFAWGLREFLKERITLEQSQEIIKRRLANRESNLLTLVKRAIYENENSPYLKLLKLAGCEYGDFEQMVQSDGIEPTLRKLSEEGVYITSEEFKGKKEISRGGKVFQFQEREFDNPFLSGQIETSSGASRSVGTRTIYDFDYLAANWTVYEALMIDVYDFLELPFGLWLPIMLGAGPLLLLAYTKAGKPPVKWFSPVEKKGFKPSLKSRMGNNYIVYMGRLLGKKWPGPEYVSLDDAFVIAQWMAGAVKEFGGCVMGTYPSAAVSICQAARERGFNIAGTKFLIGGEPITQAKRKELESVGATVFPTYGFMEAGLVGIGCFNSSGGDDVHLLKDSLALIQHKRNVPHAAVSVDAFLFTSLLPSAPKILLNVESGDYGVIETRSCGCKFEELGFTDHIYDIRSFDKLTSAGMTFIGTDLVRIIEEVLPAKFGGASTDYQMVEEEDEQDHTSMNLIVSPEVGVINEDELIQIILTELGKGGDTQRMMAEVWSQAKTLRVKRMAPFTTARGKLLPLHIQKGK